MTDPRPLPGQGNTRTPSDLREVVKSLPRQEREAYKAAQRSVTLALCHAQEHEGRRVIL